MPIAPPDDPALTRFRDAVAQMYGDRLERVVLYGSRARGDAHEDSDYDVAVFLRNIGDQWKELDRLADLSTQIVDETGELIHAMAHDATAYADRTPLMHEIRREGLDL